MIDWRLKRQSSAKYSYVKFETVANMWKLHISMTAYVKFTQYYKIWYEGMIILLSSNIIFFDSMLFYFWHLFHAKMRFTVIWSSETITLKSKSSWFWMVISVRSDFASNQFPFISLFWKTPYTSSRVKQVFLLTSRQVKQFLIDPEALFVLFLLLHLQRHINKKTCDLNSSHNTSGNSHINLHCNDDRLQSFTILCQQG